MAALDTVVHAMLDRSRAKLLFASMISGTLQSYLFAKNRIEMEDGGHTITNPLIVGRNPNVASMQYYDTVPVAQTDEFETVEYSFSRVVGSVIISDQEQDENKGRAEIFKILKGKMMALEESISEKFSTYFVSTGTGTDPNGLSNLIPDDPTSGTVGGISLATESQWRSSSWDFDGALTADVIEEVFDDITELDLKRAKERPTAIMCGRSIYRMHKTAARDKQQISLDATGTGKKLVNLGIVGTTHNGIPLMYDENLDANKAYFINDKFLRLHILKGVNMKVKKLTAPWNMDAIGRRVVWQGQLCSWRQHRTHGVLINS